MKLSEDAVEVDNRDSEIIITMGTIGLLVGFLGANMEPIEGVEASR